MAFEKELFEAISKNDVKTVEGLISGELTHHENVDVNLDIDGTTALDRAIELQYWNIAQILLNAGAITQQKFLSENDKQSLKDKGQPSSAWKLFYATRHNDLETIKTLIAEAATDPSLNLNEVREGYSALGHAMQLGFLEIINLLKEADAECIQGNENRPDASKVAIKKAQHAQAITKTFLETQNMLDQNTQTLDKTLSDKLTEQTVLYQIEHIEGLLHIKDLKVAHHLAKSLNIKDPQEIARLVTTLNDNKPQEINRLLETFNSTHRQNLPHLDEIANDEAIEEFSHLLTLQGMGIKDSAPLPSKTRKTIPVQTVYELQATEPFLAAKKLLAQNLKPLVLNEIENPTLSLCSNYSLAFKQHATLIFEENSPFKYDFKRPLGHFDAYYTPYVQVFRDSSSQYNLIDPYTIDCLTINNYALNNLNCGEIHFQIKIGHALYSEFKNRLKIKIRHLAEIALLHQHDSLILSAINCGNFRLEDDNRGTTAQLVAQACQEVFQEPSYSHCFKNITFAIPTPDAEGERHHKIFQEMLSTLSKPNSTLKQEKELQAIRASTPPLSPNNNLLQFKNFQQKPSHTHESHLEVKTPSGALQKRK